MSMRSPRRLNDSFRTASTGSNSAIAVLSVANVFLGIALRLRPSAFSSERLTDPGHSPGHDTRSDAALTKCHVVHMQSPTLPGASISAVSFWPLHARAELPQCSVQLVFSRGQTCRARISRVGRQIM